MSGCSAIQSVKDSLPSLHHSTMNEKWHFNDSYQVKKGKGTIFNDDLNTYVILQNGAKAKSVNSNEDVLWVQEGSVIHISGQPDFINIISEDGSVLMAMKYARDSFKQDDPRTVQTQPALESKIVAIADNDIEKRVDSE